MEHSTTISGNRAVSEIQSANDRIDQPTISHATLHDAPVLPEGNLGVFGTIPVELLGMIFEFLPTVDQRNFLNALFLSSDDRLQGLRCLTASKAMRDDILQAYPAVRARNLALDGLDWVPDSMMGRWHDRNGNEHPGVAEQVIMQLSALNDKPALQAQLLSQLKSDFHRVPVAEVPSQCFALIDFWKECPEESLNIHVEVTNIVIAAIPTMTETLKEITLNEFLPTWRRFADCNPGLNERVCTTLQNMLPHLPQEALASITDFIVREASSLLSGDNFAETTIKLLQRLDSDRVVNMLPLLLAFFGDLRFPPKYTAEAFGLINDAIPNADMTQFNAQLTLELNLTQDSVRTYHWFEPDIQKPIRSIFEQILPIAFPAPCEQRNRYQQRIDRLAKAS
jgi:hypothetical protein